MQLKIKKNTLNQFVKLKSASRAFSPPHRGLPNMTKCSKLEIDNAFENDNGVMASETFQHGDSVPKPGCLQVRASE
jgi:hypothetical protein